MTYVFLLYSMIKVILFGMWKEEVGLLPIGYFLLKSTFIIFAEHAEINLREIFKFIPM